MRVARPPGCPSELLGAYLNCAPTQELLHERLLADVPSSRRFHALTRGVWPFLEALWTRPPSKMRQLKGKPKKETSKDKKERKQAMQEARQQITTVVLPTLAVVVLLIVVFVYVATRPTVTE
ncbi:single-pass membrane and coiled-coil domain-containing protein 4 isoform X1 [Microcebus murinus]|uniref:uncharacterized protein LOC105857339 isoform X1 n=1 Tax=Microcebus murinus TaxID=30608 RepID=UPI003F6CDB12